MTHAGDTALLLALGALAARFGGLIPRGDDRWRKAGGGGSRFTHLRRAMPARACTPAALVDERAPSCRCSPA